MGLGSIGPPFCSPYLVPLPLCYVSRSGLWLVVREKIDMAVSEISWSWRVLCSSHRVNTPNTPLFVQIPLPIGFTRCSSCVVARALDPKREDQNSTITSQEDLVYVGKVVAGSFVGGGAIKYGSALFPEITTPNLVLALVIILTPVLVAVFLLIKESRTDQ
ncbi:unnamed protein product [Sphenostylis stenocarpa]|uniref:Uncharacterized protein n=1 Tax=Sphenostylis stenocarpa TaxID=92480 RepID=A0AA86T7K9_9FABA|nr:unnamed protein product [Sphenostylis stenocarpa]